MKKVILTGFAGFIGSQILRDLLKKGYFVIGLDNLSEGSNVANFEELRNDDNFVPLIVDLASGDLHKYLDNLLNGKKVDYVINCAADSHVDRSWYQINKFIDSNIKGSINLALWSIENKVSKFVQVSTDEVWGGSLQPYTEESIFSPENIYSTSKASAELFLNNLYKAYALPLVITNGANTYGPRQMEEKIIPKSVKSILNNKKITLYKTPAQRMWLHVEDHSQGIILAMEKGNVGEKYCLAPEKDQELYTHELVEMICSVLGVSFDSSVDYVEDRLNYDLRYLMNNDKAKKYLGFNPSKKIREELPKVIKELSNT